MENFQMTRLNVADSYFPSAHIESIIHILLKTKRKSKESHQNVNGDKLSQRELTNQPITCDQQNLDEKLFSTNAVEFLKTNSLKKQNTKLSFI